MATDAIGGETPTLFLRKATGLVRGWSVGDSIIYACLATNFVTLGLYEFTFAGPAFPKGQFITAVLISGVWVSFLVIAYAGVVATIPRAGGDTSGRAGSWAGASALSWPPPAGGSSSGLGAHLRQHPLRPAVPAALGHAEMDPPRRRRRWSGTKNGIFIVTLITIALWGLLVSLGMAGYAKVQRWFFLGGMIGFAVVVVLLLVNSHASFVSSFNLEGQKLFGVHNAYPATNAAAHKAGYTTSPFGFGPLGPTSCSCRPLCSSSYGRTGGPPSTGRSAGRMTSGGYSPACSSACGRRSS